jgi:hypothetical protein
MTSQIVSSTIDADYPVAGQDNDSQGFRDNFSIIKDGLATGAAEITDLQTNTAKLNADNDFQGNVIANAQTNRLYGTVYHTSSTPTTNVSLNDGEYQAITLIGNATLTFVDWPEIDRFAKIRLALKSNGTEQTITFASEGGGVVRTEVTPTLATVTGASRKTSSIATTSATFSYPTANSSVTPVLIGDKLFGTGLSGSVTVTDVANLTATSSESLGPVTLSYTSIAGNGQVTTSTTAASITTGSKVTFSNVTGMGGLSTGTIYYTFNASGLGFKIATSYANALAGTAIATLNGTISYSAISDVGRVTTATSAAGIPRGDQVTLSDVTGLTGLTTGTTYFVYGADATGFNLAASYADAMATIPVPVTGATGSFTGTATATYTGAVITTGTATFAELDPSSNVLKLSSIANIYEGMPIRFTGTTFGGVAIGTDYFVLKVINSGGVLGVRLSLTLGGAPLALTAYGTGPGETNLLTMVPTTVVSASISPQAIAGGSGLTLTTANTVFPTPFTVSSDVNKIRIVDAWTSDGGTNIFIKYLGEYA